MDSTEPLSNTTLSAIARDLDDGDAFVVTTHAKPDGDALGSAIALRHALQLKNKHAELWLMPPLYQAHRALLQDVPYRMHGERSDPFPAFEPDRVVVTDTGAWSQLEPMRVWLAPRWSKNIIVDHHLRADEVAAQRHIDATAAASCEIVADLIDALGVDFDRCIATALYMGIASDTGWFRFSNTRAETHELAARLLRCGVDHGDLYSRLEQGERPEKLRLVLRALDSLRLVKDGTAAIMTLRASDFADTGAVPAETERLVDLPQIVRDVQIVVLLTEENGATRLSFRSKPGNTAIDVNQLAKRFGGGGHARAAGAKVQEPVEMVTERLIRAIETGP